MTGERVSSACSASTSTPSIQHENRKISDMAIRASFFFFFVPKNVQVTRLIVKSFKKQAKQLYPVFYSEAHFGICTSNVTLKR